MVKKFKPCGKLLAGQPGEFEGGTWQDYNVDASLLEFWYTSTTRGATCGELEVPKEDPLDVVPVALCNRCATKLGLTW